MSNETDSEELDFANICRTCLSTKDLKLLYDDCASEVCFAHMLMSCTVLRFCENDGLPIQICSVCIYKISETYKFALQCEETDKLLRNYLEKRFKNLRNTKVATDFEKSSSDSKNYYIINEPDNNCKNDEEKIENAFLSNNYFAKTQNIETEVPNIQTNISAEDPKIIIDFDKYKEINLSIQNDHDYFYNAQKCRISSENPQTVDLIQTSFNNLDNDLAKVKYSRETSENLTSEIKQSLTQILSKKYATNNQYIIQLQPINKLSTKTTHVPIANQKFDSYLPETPTGQTSTNKSERKLDENTSKTVKTNNKLITRNASNLTVNCQSELKTDMNVELSNRDNALSEPNYQNELSYFVFNSDNERDNYIGNYQSALINFITNDFGELININNEELSNCSSLQTVNSATSEGKQQIKSSVEENFNSDFNIKENRVILFKNELKTTINELKTPKSDVQLSTSEFKAPKSELQSPTSDFKSPKSELKSPKIEVKPPKSELKPLKIELFTPKVKHFVCSTKSDLKSPENYFKLSISELKSPKNELQSSTSDFKSSKNKLKSLKMELNSPKSELKSPKSELKSPKNELKPPISELKSPKIKQFVYITKNELKSSKNDLKITKIINFDYTKNYQRDLINVDTINIGELLNINNDQLSHCSASKTIDSATSVVGNCTNKFKITQKCIKLITNKPKSFRNELTSTKNILKLSKNKNKCKKELKPSKSDVNTTQTKNKPIYDCKKCGETFLLKSLLREHFKKIPHKYTRKPCPICAKPVTYWYFLRHIESHKGLRSHICEVCGKSFVNDTNYKRHKNIHLGIKPFTCDVCGKGFVQSFSLKEHRRIHTGERPHICYKCGKTFRSSVYLKQHLDKHEKEDSSAENLVSEEPKLPITCEICNQVYTTLRGFKTHSVTHQEKSFCCPICCKSFITEYRLTMHKRYNHGHRKFACEICSKTFSIRNSFKMHMLSHSGQKDHSCEVCLRKFNSLGHVRYHMLTHTGEKPHKCTVCGKAFAGNGNLVVHMRTHTGETPYLCPVCQKGFYDSSSMKKHFIAHSKTK